MPHCSFVAFFTTPIASIPAFVTAPALVYIAARFLSLLRNLDWEDITIAMPAMLMAILMPLTFSIASNIAISFLDFVLIHVPAGRTTRINAGTCVIMGYGCLWLATSFI